MYTLKKIFLAFVVKIATIFIVFTRKGSQYITSDIAKDKSFFILILIQGKKLTELETTWKTRRLK